MDPYTKYDEKTIEMLNACMRYLAVISPKALFVIRRIRRQAEETDDNYLRGFSLFHQAMYQFYTDAESGKYRSTLNKAVFFLLRADDKDMLSRAYNFVAVDAHNNGSFDIAYNYYMMALRFSEESGRPRAVSLIETNLGRLYSELGDHKLARKHIRAGIRAFRRQKDDLRYIPNLSIALVNDGITSVNLGDLPSAERARNEIAKLKKRADEAALEEICLPCLFLDVRLAYAKKDRKAAKRLTDALCDRLRVEPVLQEMIDDIHSFCAALMQLGKPEPVGLVIDAAKERIMSCSVIHVMRIFSEIQVDYYEAVHDKKHLDESLQEQHALFKRQRMEQRQMYRNAMDLVNLVDELRAEQERVRRENIMLQTQAMTDELTSLPNRYMMNKVLESAFEKGAADQRAVGVEILDIDCFKEYNDTYGHPAGDRCLKKIAQVLHEVASQEGITCARYGGDEFVIIYEGKTDQEIRAVMQTIKERIAAMRMVHRRSKAGSFVTVSQGFFSGMPDARTKPWDYLAEADASLYRAKRRRRFSS